jgi:hypothetical protein
MGDCPGVLIWFPCEGGALLVCSHCGDLFTTGWPLDERHAHNEVLMEGTST